MIQGQKNNDQGIKLVGQVAAITEELKKTQREQNDKIKEIKITSNKMRMQMADLMYKGTTNIASGDS